MLRETKIYEKMLGELVLILSEFITMSNLTRRQKGRQRRDWLPWLKSYLGDAIEASHERIKRVEEAQDVVQVSGQSRVIM